MKQLKEIFKKENLTIPNYDNINIIDLIRTLYNYCGCNYKKNSNMKNLNKIISNKKHIVFIIIDGFGSNLVNKLQKNSLFVKNKVMDLMTVFPSATGCVLTSIATGEYPSKTGIYGWYGYLKNKNLNYYTLLFKERYNKTDLIIDKSEIFKSQSKMNKLKRKTQILYPNFLVNSQYSSFVASDEKRCGYDNYNEAIEYIKSFISNDHSTFSYLYIPEVDTLEHKYGLNNAKIYNQVAEIDKAINKLLPVDDDTEIIITADHGQISITDIVLMDFNKYNKYFYAPPAIDLGTATYFVKKEYINKFQSEFYNDFFDKMYLFDTRKLIKYQFFGKKMSTYAKDNLGEFVSICKSGYAFFNSYDEFKEDNVIKGNHTGLSKEELTIPLIVIKKND